MNRETDDIPGIKRLVRAYEKKPGKYGNHYLVTQYELEPVSLDFLQKVFNVSPDDPDPVMRGVMYNYDIGSEEANALQPYVKAKIDLEQYIFQLASGGSGGPIEVIW